jgi:DNA-binding NtrC family response regulator
MKTKMLIADDDQDAREIIKLALGNDRYEMSEAESIAGLRRLLDGPAPEVVLLDLSFPDGNSLSVLPELKQKWRASKVIILTGYGTVDAAEQAYKLDGSLFLQSKPFDLETLRVLVELAAATKPAARA